MAIILDDAYMKKIQEETKKETNSVKVKNIKHTSSKKHKRPLNGRESWLDYYKKSKGISSDMTLPCANIACNKKAEVGGHVKKDDSEKKWYITPLCSKCNNFNNEDSFTVRKDNLVPIDDN